ncbi:MAG: ComF family protein [Oscillospiraceae bacterium]|nr:ComF family protein [Oscillospiraceae bacterium]
MSWTDWLLDLIFPPKCILCGALMDSSAEKLCGGCIKTLPRYRNERAKKTEFVPAVAVALCYEGNVRESLRRYKFGGRRHYAPFYAALMWEAVETQLDRPFDTLSYVPLSRKRLRQRGYDQTRLLAEELGKILGMEPQPLLRKRRNVPAQSTMKTPAERRANISGCYAVVDAAAVRGKRILLVDDIFTTGATLSEAARMLRMAGAAEVYGAAVACAQKKTGNK